MEINFVHFFFERYQNTCGNMCWLLIILGVIGFLFVLSAYRWFCWYFNRLKYYDRLEREAISRETVTNGKSFEAKTSNECQWWWQARIYQIIIDRFNGGWQKAPRYESIKEMNCFLGGNLDGVTNKLDYIKALGYNTILLSPIHESAAYHGYHITDYEKICRSFGNWNDFCNLVHLAHLKGIRVICDFVPNHCHKKNYLYKDAKWHRNGKRNWFYFSHFFSFSSTHFLRFKELPKLNLNNKETADYIIGIAEKLANIGIDGIRIDHVIGVPFDFLRKLRLSLKAINPDFFVFGEATALGIKKEEFRQICFKNEILRKKALRKALDRDELQGQYVDIIDGVLDFEFRDIIRKEIEAGNHILGNLVLYQKLHEHFIKYPRNFALVLLLDNHDVDRLMFYCKNDKRMVDEILNFMKVLPYPSSVYYGTEQYMTHKDTIENVKRAYADLDVRQPMDWSI